MSGLLRSTKRLLYKPVWLVSSSFISACLVAGLVTMALGVPIPRVHDEFAYLLGADTYANGRIVNPSHVHWQHFETFHVLTHPIYLPKYPPGQSLFLALGQWLGHPYLGVLLSTGLASGSLAWMLSAWLPKRYCWLACLIAVLHPGLQIKWNNSYMGGAVSLIGACLLLGALGFARRRLTVKLSLTAALGIVILANSRPFEGMVLTACVGLCLLLTLAKSGQWRVAELARKLFLPAGALLIVAGFFMAYNNYRTTGSAAHLPYQMYETQYGKSPIFVWQADKPQSPIYRHRTMERFYEDEAAGIKAKFSNPVSIFREKMNSLAELIHFFGGGTQYVFLLGLPLILRWSRYRMAAALLIPVLLAAVATPWTLTHYAAPAAPLIILVLLAGAIEVSRLIARSTSSIAIPDKPSKLRMALIVIGLALLTLHGLTLFKNDRRANQIGWAQRRQDLYLELIARPGQDLVFVKYSEDHNPHEEWVYNAADIDSAPVIWARQISPQADGELIRYFNDRRVVVIEADGTKE